MEHTQYAVVDLGALLLSKATINDPISHASSVAMAYGIGVSLTIGSKADMSEKSLLSREAVTLFALTVASGWALDLSAMTEIPNSFTHEWASVMDFAGIVTDLFNASDIDQLVDKGAFLDTPHALLARDGHPPVYITATHSLFDIYGMIFDLRS